MSFRDVPNDSPRRRRHYPPSRRVASPPQKTSSQYRRKLDQLRGKPNPQPEQPPSPMPNRLESNPFIQIDRALMQHRKDHGWKKEQSLAEQSTTVPRPSPRSPFSKLNEDIVQFQKMVQDLGSLLEGGRMDSPEHQWRTQILRRSAEDADRDIQQKINQLQSVPRDGVLKASFQKLERDYNRIQTKFHSLIHQYDQQQKAEVALLSAQLDEFDAGQQQRENQQIVQEEDFFDRKMREREEEVKKINSKMHQVNKIYKELEKIIDEQQEKIDAVVENVGYSRAAAQCGLERMPKKATINDILRDGSDFNWKDPFINFHEDFLSFQREILSYGVKNIGTATNVRCSPICGNDQVSNAEFYHDTRRQYV